MDAQSLQQLEQVCLQLYDQTTSPAARENAQKMIEVFEASSDVIVRCRNILDMSSLSYAQLLAAATLTKAVSKSNCTLLLQERVQIRDYALEFLYNREGLQSFVVAELCKLLSRLIKYGWFDADDDQSFPLRLVTSSISRFLNGTTVHKIILVHLLGQLVSEMSQTDQTQGLSRHRKVSSSFRDEELFGVFELALSIANKVAPNVVRAGNQQELVLLEYTLQLVQVCLNFDFIGTCADESVDDFRTVQIPASWKDLIVADSTLSLFFNLYMNLEPPISGHAMGCLVQLASVRRTLFNTQQRGEFLTRLINGVCDILRTSHGLKDQDNYHEFCRFLARLRANYQLPEMVDVESYTQFITGVAEFTILSLQNWHWSANSLHYLLGMWERMVSSVPYLKTEKPHNLETIVPRVVEAYVQSRLDSVEPVVRQGLDDLLDDVTSLEAQLKQLSVILHCQYTKTCTFLAALFDPLAQAYASMLQQGRLEDVMLRVLEGQLTWLIYIFGAAIGGRISSFSSEGIDEMDSELVCRALQLMHVKDERLGMRQDSYESLDLAFISLFQQVRMIYVGDQVMKSSKVFTRLQVTLGLKDESALLDVLVNKIVTNLKYWVHSDLVIDRTLELLGDMCVGFTSVRRLVKLETVHFMLENHTPQNFPFLEEVSDTRHRTTFYSALARLLTLDSSEDNGAFERFMRPLGVVLDALLQQLSVGVIPTDIRVKTAVLGVVRDLRGVAVACTTKSSYMLFFDWLYPRYLPVIVRGIEIWYNVPEVAVPILKFMNEFVMNRGSRLQFGVSSPNGILLFRETSKVVVAYSSRILTLTGLNATNVYREKYKGVSVIFRILKSALTGEYVNFGVFQLYGDNALDSSLNAFVELFASIPLEDLLNYPKLSKDFYFLLVSITHDHMSLLARLDPTTFRYLGEAIYLGLKSLDTNISTQCCSSLDNILTYFFTGLAKTKQDDAMVALSQLMNTCVGVFNQMLTYSLNVVMFEDCKNLWSLSRPMLALVLLQPAYFREAQERILPILPSHKQQQVMDCFTMLMEGVDSTLSSRNRDRFTQNLAIFRRDVNNFTKSIHAPDTP
eukprot:m.158193 g.158193  ORF g.158193 m.158193 type:complete len:1075 (+) comp17011_c0_seq2:97-3321(+)